MKKKIFTLAYKYRKNKMARFIFLPFWHFYFFCLSKIRNKRYRQNAVAVLTKFNQILEKNNVFFWLEFGTLLGAYRENDFIAHDMDIDTGVFYKDRKSLERSLQNTGFKLIKQYSVDDGEQGFEQTYKYLGVTIDVFFFFEDKNSMYCNTFWPFDGESDNPNCVNSERQIRVHTVPYNGFVKRPFKGGEYNVPAKTEIHLKAHYGESFMIPNPNFNQKNDAPNIYTFDRSEKVGIFTNYEL